jgi:hypothetical protein
MKTHTSALVALTLSATLAMGTSTADAAETSHFKVAGNSLIANFLAFAPDNCWVASTRVELAESVVWTKGKPMPNPTVLVDVEYSNSCGPGGESDPEHIVLTGFATSSTWWMRGDMGAATLSGTVLVGPEGSVGTIPVVFNLAFTATGPATGAQDTFHSNSGGIVFNSSFKFSSRPADATGSAKVTFASSGEINLTGGVPSLSGSIGTSNNGEIVIIKK